MGSLARLAFRFVARRWISFGLVGAFLAIGLAFLVTFSSVLKGLGGHLRDAIRETDAEVTLRPVAGRLPAGGMDAVLARVRATAGVASAGPEISFPVLLERREIRTGPGGRTVGWAGVPDRFREVEARGIDWASEAGAGGLVKFWRASRLEDRARFGLPPEPAGLPRDPLRSAPGEEPRLLVGRELAEILGLEVGDRIVLATLSPNPDEETMERRTFRIAGTLKSGHYRFDSKAMVGDFAAMSAFFRPSVRCESVRIAAASGESLEGLRDRVAAAASPADAPPRFEAMTWKDRHRLFLAALTLEHHLSVFILSLLGGVILAGLYSLLSLLVFEKTRDIGILRAIGLTRARTAGVFLLAGAWVGIPGAIVGTGLGLCGSYWTGWWSGIIFPRSIYYLEQIPTEIEPAAIAGFACLALGASLLASAVPALRVLRMPTAEALAYE